MRAREPDHQGYVDNDGVKIGYEVFGAGDQTILLLQTWTIIHSRFWKAQIHYLARHFRVVTYDGPGNGLSDRVLDPSAYTADAYANAALAVLDATDTDRAVLVSLSAGAGWQLKLMAEYPQRCLGGVFIGPSLLIAPSHPERIPMVEGFDAPPPTTDGWWKYNGHHWRENWLDFSQFFFEQCFNEPHSTKQIEDCVGWSLDTTVDVMIADAKAEWPSKDQCFEWMHRVTAPVLVLHGEEDLISPLTRAQVLAENTGGTLVTMEGSGHIPLARDPVAVNLHIAEFVHGLSLPAPTTQAAPATPAPPAKKWTRGKARPKRALYISSPIGLGHAQRDLAIAQNLRNHHPDLQIDWLAQHPVTRVLSGAGETVHPASAWLSSESAHIEDESAEHDLHCFQAWRRMDEILVANFMVFHDVVTSQDYDLVIGDEAWDVDYYLHENPELKRFAYAWFTDFVGWLPMPDGGDREAFLTADYNAEMIEHIARYPRIRDRAIFVGDPDDIVPHDFGPGLPAIRDWTEDHYDFAGYVTGFDPAAFADRDAIRSELGYRDDERVCIVTVGGSGVGGHLLRRVIDAFPDAKRDVPDLRMIVVAGPRIDPKSLPAQPGLEVRPYVHELYRHLAVCDLAVVQSGLTTTMELTATNRPFIARPLRHHFEQNFHVAHRLNRYGAGRRLEYDDATPEALTTAIAEDIHRTVSYRPVVGDGAAKAAAMLADLL